MTSYYILTSFFLMWHLLVILAILFGLSGLDDLFIDIFFWIRYVWRLYKIRHYEPLTYEKLLAKEEQAIAILLPCWQEASVIGNMLKHNYYSIDYKNYHIFVGVYPNDLETIKVVDYIAQKNPNIHCVVGRTPGPTNKAANLTQIYQHIKKFETSLEQPFSIYVFHDSEDIIHPLSFKLYNYLIPKKDMIQIPIFPLDVPYHHFTHWLYADEFSENHTKNIIVREAIGAHVPSAGVGTAFSRQALEILDIHQQQSPFSLDSLTEDYRTSLNIRIKALKAIFVTQSVIRQRWVKKGIFKTRYTQQTYREFIATRAMFPNEYKKSVRQKARWIMGIVFQEWDQQTWPSDWRIRYSLMHDRKSFATHFINGFSYFVFLYWIIYSITFNDNPDYPSLQEQFNLHPWVWWLIMSVSVIMMERLTQRMIAVYRVYGFFPAILAIPRVFYGNLLNLQALMRAYKLYFSAEKKQAKNSKKTPINPSWDKTEHQFPGRHLLTPYKKRLGDLLLEQGLVSPEALAEALLIHNHTGERLGSILQRMQLLTTEQLTKILSKQYHLQLMSKEKVAQQTSIYCQKLSKSQLKWVNKMHISVVKLEHPQITIAIKDPTNELLLKRITQYFSPLNVEFVLII